MKFILKILVTTGAVLLTTYLLPNMVWMDGGFKTALIVALALAFLNAVVKPIMIILTIPATIFTFGLFLLVINALIIEIAAHFITQFHVHDFWAAMIFSIILTIVNSVFERLTKEEDQQNRS